jgi:hypothetical protein
VVSRGNVSWPVNVSTHSLYCFGEIFIKLHVILIYRKLETKFQKVPYLILSELLEERKIFNNRSKQFRGFSRKYAEKIKRLLIGKSKLGNFSILSYFLVGKAPLLRH